MRDTKTASAGRKSPKLERVNSMKLDKLEGGMVAFAIIAPIAALLWGIANDVTPNPLIILALIIVCYFLPSIIASFRGHHQMAAIFLLNIFIGWTSIGWVAALVWAATAIKRRNAEGKLA